ncbi:MAG: Sec-independent protein translocase protein TatB [Sulfurimonas sp.]|nr:Sec-independent protein translocase protein TatB [Sulfurimonas sp.]MDD3060171.1 Sec-independent protein translocase protein TatB [Sulfurimonas sp.]
MFGMGFTEILIILVVAILFLGPDKLPTAMVDIAKFFRNMKKTIGTLKDSIEEEMNVSEIKQEALAYKKELLSASEELNRVTDMTKIGEEMSKLGDDILTDVEKPSAPKAAPIQEKITFEKKPKPIAKEENTDV